MGRGDCPNPNRPYPPPGVATATPSRGDERPRPWIMAMDWHDLLFMHWRIEPARLRPFVPPQLVIETYDGAAWLGIVPFVMRRTRARGTPPIPGLSRFCELNVRTYVHPHGQSPPRPGVWFFSLDAASRAAVMAARATYHLPYFHATMSCRRERSGAAAASDTAATRANDSAAAHPAHEADEWIVYRSVRRNPQAPLAYGGRRGGPAEFAARYRPLPAQRGGSASAPPQAGSEPAPPRPGSLESFLTDRYCLYAHTRSGAIYRTEVHHPPWPLQPAAAEVQTNTVATFLGVDLSELERAGGPPLLHYSRFIRVAAWWPRREDGGRRQQTAAD